MEEDNIKEEKLKELKMTLCLGKLIKILTMNGMTVSEILMIYDIFKNKVLESSSGFSFKFYIISITMQLIIYASNDNMLMKLQEEIEYSLDNMEKENKRLY